MNKKEDAAVFGWGTEILTVNLTSGKVERSDFPRDLGVSYLGGRGIGSRILYDQVKAGTEALSPENVLVFGTGPLGGTIAPSSNRVSVTAKSPLYQGMGQSNCGGTFGPELKWAGYSHLVIHGKAQEPVYLWIDDDRVEIRAAGHLWGRSTWETDRIISNELGNSSAKIAAIGPAGERLAKLSLILVTKYRAAAQAGMGAVMGSKNLKAVAVRGTKSVRVAQPLLLRDRALEVSRRIRENPAYEAWSTLGTTILTPGLSEMGILSIKNYQQTGCWEKLRGISAEAFSRYFSRSKSCHSCPIHCGHHFEVKEGRYGGEKGHGIEAGVIIPFGPMLDNDDPESLFKCLNLCNQYGMDSLELGYAISAAMEWYEKGVITKGDLDGMSLKWGDTEAIIELIHKAGKREGIGDLLADGAVHAARSIGRGAEAYISHCKGMMLGADDLRADKGSALNTVTSTIPSHQEEGWTPPLTPEMAKAYFGDEAIADVTSYKGKALSTSHFQDLCMVCDAMEVCKFASGWVHQEISFKELSELFEAATGSGMDESSLRLAAARILDLERLFAAREGMSRKDDRPSGKIMAEPVQSGPFKGAVVDQKQFEAMLDEYYDVRGWDRARGIPTQEELRRVGLESEGAEVIRVADPGG